MMKKLRACGKWLITLCFIMFSATVVAYDGHEKLWGIAAGIDKSTSSLQIIEYEHSEIHSGSNYMLSYNTTLAAGADATVRIQTPNTTKWSHMIWNLQSDAVMTAYLRETYTGVHAVIRELDPINRNRNSTNTSDLIICHSPVAAADGDIIWQDAAGAAGNPLSSSGGSASSRGELILKQNTVYLFSVDGADGDVVTINLNWYEHTDKR